MFCGDGRSPPPVRTKHEYLYEAYSLSHRVLDDGRGGGGVGDGVGGGWSWGWDGGCRMVYQPLLAATRV